MFQNTKPLVRKRRVANFVIDPKETISPRGNEKTSVTVKSSAETTNTGVTKEIQSLSFGVRQCAFLRCVNPTTHKILFHGSVYDIKSITPDYLKNDYLTIVCEARKAGADDDFY